MKFIEPTAEIGEGCTIGFGVVIEKEVKIGKHCQIAHHAVVYAGTVIGERCKVGAHAVLGKPANPAPTSVNKSSQKLSPLVIGDDCIVGAQAVVYRGTSIGRKSLVADLSFIRENTEIGDHVIVGAHVMIENRVKIGAYTKIQTGAYITAATTIEERVFIAPGIVTTNDNYMGRTEERFKHWGGAMIRRGARVGANVTILPNVEIAEEAFVAAGSLATKNIPQKTLAMGSPAKPKRPVPENEWIETQKAAP